MDNSLLRLSQLSDADVSILLDPEQPYLKDHDVGVPLFGTVMSLEAMTETVNRIFGVIPVVLENITAGEDCLVKECLTVIGSARRENKGYYCEIKKAGAAFFSCSVRTESAEALAVDCGRSIFLRKPDVKRSDIYNSFFHGPAFQVVEEAWFDGAHLYSRLNPSLPSLCVDSEAAPLLPVRIIELCLQTSGLFDAAVSHYMSVPLGIEKIELFERKPEGVVSAMASAGSCGTDMVAWDEKGNLLLRIRGYQTKAMPYSGEGFDRLCRKFGENYED